MKWVGGKRRLLPQILELLGPRERIGRYVEPFLGGGAVLLGLRPEYAVVTDTNRELVNAYWQVERDPIALTFELLEHVERHGREHFKSVRDWDRSPDFLVAHNAVARAGRFIYLNKACFNGLWRVSSRDQFNVPFAGREKVDFDLDNLVRVSEYLQRSTSVFCAGFEKSLAMAGPGTVYYLDPPYVPLKDPEARFGGYSKDAFTLDDQRRLVQFCHDIVRRGGRFVLSNSDCPTTRELYRDFDVREIDVNRLCGGRGSARRPVTELLVTGGRP